MWLTWLGILRALKGWRFKSRSGHMPRLQVRSLVEGMQEATNQWFLLTLMFPSLFKKSIRIAFKVVSIKWNFLRTQFSKQQLLNKTQRALGLYTIKTWDFWTSAYRRTVTSLNSLLCICLHISCNYFLIFSSSSILSKEC